MSDFRIVRPTEAHDRTGPNVDDVTSNVAKQDLQPSQSLFRRFLHNRVGMVALTFLAILVILAVFAPLLTPFGPKFTLAQRRAGIAELDPPLRR